MQYAIGNWQEEKAWGNLLVARCKKNNLTIKQLIPYKTRHFFSIIANILVCRIRNVMSFFYIAYCLLPISQQAISLASQFELPIQEGIHVN